MTRIVLLMAAFVAGCSGDSAGTESGASGSWSVSGTRPSGAAASCVPAPLPVRMEFEGQLAVTFADGTSPTVDWTVVAGGAASTSTTSFVFDDLAWDLYSVEVLVDGDAITNGIVQYRALPGGVICSVSVTGHRQ